jgi:recombinational DNA repair protein (RecF pathway)
VPVLDPTTRDSALLDTLAQCIHTGGTTWGKNELPVSGQFRQSHDNPPQQSLEMVITRLVCGQSTNNSLEASFTAGQPHSRLFASLSDIVPQVLQCALDNARSYAYAFLRSDVPLERRSAIPRSWNSICQYGEL